MPTKPRKPSPELKRAASRAAKKALRPMRPVTLAHRPDEVMPPRSKVATFLAPPIKAFLSPEELTPLDIPSEAHPELHIALYSPDALEPEAVVVAARGKKSLFKRFSDWLDGE